MSLSPRFTTSGLFTAMLAAGLCAGAARIARAQGQGDGFENGYADPSRPAAEGPPAPGDPDAPGGPMAQSDPTIDYPGGLPDGYGPPSPPSGEDTYGTSLIPPNVEGDPYAVAAGSYCYAGPHPVDTRVVPGPSWDDTQGQHLRPYPPIDTRLFALRDGCYTFTGDPRDFGFSGQAYAYYGAHPILDVYGGGWCFMMGPHTHAWAPWSPNFIVVGPWFYWQGPYDPFFWAYWPYYSFYYRSYYPTYYGQGRFYRGGGGRVAPPIRAVPASAWRASTPVRGSAPTQAYRAPGAPLATPGRAFPAPVPAPARPTFTPAPRPFAPAPGAGIGARGRRR